MKTKIIKTDVVKHMRKIRDKVSIEIMDLNIDQEKEYIKLQLKELKNKRLEKLHL